MRARRNAGKIKFSGRFSGVVAEAEGTQSREQCRGQKKINTPFTSLRNASDINGRQQRLNSRTDGNRGTQVPSPATKTRGQLLAQERDIERLRAEGHTAICQLRQDLDSGFRNELEKMKDNDLARITHQLRELESGKNRRPTASILTILQASEREIQKQSEQQMQMGNDLLQTELFDQAVRLITNCDDTCADIKEEYQKELTVFAQRGRQSNCDGRFGSFQGAWRGRRAERRGSVRAF